MPETKITKLNQVVNWFFLSCSNLPSSSNNSTEFDDPALIQNIEKNHVGVSERLSFFIILSKPVLPKSDLELPRSISYVSVFVCVCVCVFSLHPLKSASSWRWWRCVTRWSQRERKTRSSIRRLRQMKERWSKGPKDSALFSLRERRIQS